jgi:hypothetical protein
VTFAKGDRVKVEFEGMIYGQDDEEIYSVTDVDGSEYFIDQKFLTKIEKVYPAGTVWVWRRDDGSPDTVRTVVGRTTTDFCRTYDVEPADIIAIHEPEAS